MREWESLSHVRWYCRYHVVFVPKYRKRSIFVNLRKDIGRILRELCVQHEVALILIVEEQGRYRLTVGLFEEWLRWTHDPERKPERSTPPPPANPSDEEIQWLQERIREGFSSPQDLEILARGMRVAPAEAIRTNAVLPVQISDLVDWAVRNRRFWDLRDAVQRERPTFFQGNVGHTVVMQVGSAGTGRRSGQGGAGTA